MKTQVFFVVWVAAKSQDQACARSVRHTGVFRGIYARAGSAGYFFMTPTTHIASSCLLTAVMVNSATGETTVLAVLSIGSLALHFLLDCIPHGFITTPWTLCKKLVPTVAELMPGPLILAASILVFGHPVLFVLAASFCLLPDICSTMVWRRSRFAEMLPVRIVHRLHRRAHWFEKDHPDGSVTHLFRNPPLLAAEACFLALVLVTLFVKA